MRNRKWSLGNGEEEICKEIGRGNRKEMGRRKWEGGNGEKEMGLWGGR